LFPRQSYDLSSLHIRRSSNQPLKINGCSRKKILRSTGDSMAHSDKRMSSRMSIRIESGKGGSKVEGAHWLLVCQALLIHKGGEPSLISVIRATGEIRPQTCWRVPKTWSATRTQGDGGNLRRMSTRRTSSATIGTK